MKNHKSLHIICLTSLLIILYSIQSFAQIKISGNGRYFTDGKGKPLFWQGDTEWDLFQQLSFSEAKSLLMERKKQGFNVFPGNGNRSFSRMGKDDEKRVLERIASLDER